LADYAGIFVMLAIGSGVVVGLMGLQRLLAGRAGPASGSAAGSDEPTAKAERSGSQTRFRVGFLFGALVFLVALVGLIALIPWALAARSLGLTGLLALAAFALPVGIGLLHAASRGALEW
jgi:NADH:ubiquinone oxidoreductase subunit 3 (subunit A)